MDLEGKYFGFDFSADYTQECEQGSALAILQVINGQLQEVFHPLDHNEETIGEIEIGQRESELALVYLQKLGVKELYSTLSRTFPRQINNEQFLGLTVYFDGNKIDPEDKTRYMYEGLCSDERKMTSGINL